MPGQIWGMTPKAAGERERTMPGGSPQEALRVQPDDEQRQGREERDRKVGGRGVGHRSLHTRGLVATTART